MTIDERLCVTVQAISPVQEIGISHVGQAVFVTEPDRQQAIVFSVSVRRERDRKRGDSEKNKAFRWPEMVL